MREISLIVLAIILLVACKNNGQKTVPSPKVEEPQVSSVLKKITVDGARNAPEKVDFRVLEWRAFRDTLRVVVSYSGGCEEHDFNAYFSGAWLKSMPPQAIIELEHLNPEKDACRSMVKDTFYFDLDPVRYNGQTTVVVKWNLDSERIARYEYGN